MTLRAIPVECKLLIRCPMMDRSKDKDHMYMDYFFQEVKIGLHGATNPYLETSKVTDTLMTIQNQKSLLQGNRKCSKIQKEAAKKRRIQLDRS